MFLLRVSSISKPTGQFFCKFISQSAKENRRYLSILSSRCRRSFNSMQITNFRSLFLSSRLEKSVMITFVKDDGTEVKRRAQIGKKLQDLVKVNNDPDIPLYGSCGGVTACSTCHVILSKEIFEKLEPVTSDEEDILVFAPDYCETSRLGCHVTITKDMDGLVVRVPSAKRDLRVKDLNKTIT